MTTPKPLGRKAYGSIGHLPESRIGPGDHMVHSGQAAICTVKPRDRHDLIIVQEKLDGSCTAVARLDGVLIPLGRAGHPAITSPYEQHQLFAQWVYTQQARFLGVLRDGERLVGEWLAQAHGTRYILPHDPWVAFDLMVGDKRLPFDVFSDRISGVFPTPSVLYYGASALAIAHAMELLGTYGRHGAIDPVEGAVWRVERKGEVDFLAKYVRPDKVDGLYLPELSGNEAVWNWRPA